MKKNIAHRKLALAASKKGYKVQIVRGAATNNLRLVPAKGKTLVTTLALDASKKGYADASVTTALGDISKLNASFHDTPKYLEHYDGAGLQLLDTALDSLLTDCRNATDIQDLEDTLAHWLKDEAVYQLASSWVKKADSLYTAIDAVEQFVDQVRLDMAHLGESRVSEANYEKFLSKYPRFEEFGYGDGYGNIYPKSEYSTLWRRLKPKSWGTLCITPDGEVVNKRSVESPYRKPYAPYPYNIEYNTKKTAARFRPFYEAMLAAIDGDDVNASRKRMNCSRKEYFAVPMIDRKLIAKIEGDDATDEEIYEELCSSGYWCDKSEMYRDNTKFYYLSWDGNVLEA